jgi:autophagy-related protein 2
LAVKDITVQDTNKAGRVTSLLSPAEYKDLVSVAREIGVYPRDLTLLQRSNPRSLLELHLISKTVRGTNAKESRVKVSLNSFAYNLFTDFDFAADLGTFFKAPPGVSSHCTPVSILTHSNLVLQAFESVVPAERTKLTVRITDGSVKAHAPTHPGALVIYAGDLTVNTDIVGDAASSFLHVLVPDLSILLLDDLESRPDGSVTNRLPASVNQGVPYWKVRFRISR